VIRNLAVVALGGAIGAVARWSLGQWLPDGSGFPWTTFAINVVGSFLLAMLPAIGAVLRHERWPLFLGTGVLGGFTTLSTYAVQGRGLLAEGSPWLAFGYLAGTLVACLAAVLIAQQFVSVAAQQEFEADEGDE
jgi:CrcB protein